MKLSEILRAGKQRIETLGWGQGAGEVLYANLHGRPNKCCALTAISGLPDGSLELIDLHVAAIGMFELVNGFDSPSELVRWNDAPERTVADVLAAYDKAIAAAEAQEQANG